MANQTEKDYKISRFIEPIEHGCSGCIREYDEDFTALKRTVYQITNSTTLNHSTIITECNKQKIQQEHAKKGAEQKEIDTIKKLYGF